MPTPNKGESKDAFIARCVRVIRKEGKTHATTKGVTDMEAILGKCYGLWNNAHGGK